MKSGSIVMRSSAKPGAKPKAGRWPKRVKRNGGETKKKTGGGWVGGLSR